MKKDKNSISVIYTTNFTSPRNYVPLTGWILAHRIAHILHFSKGSKISKSLFSIEADLHNLILDINQKVYGLDSHARRISADYPVMENITENMRELFQALATMRSARMGKLRSNVNWSAELFAQHIITGRVKFSQLPDQISENTANENQGQYDKIVQDFANKLHDRFDNLLKMMVGKVFVL